MEETLGLSLIDEEETRELNYCEDEIWKIKCIFEKIHQLVGTKKPAITKTTYELKYRKRLWTLKRNQ